MRYTKAVMTLLVAAALPGCSSLPATPEPIEMVSSLNRGMTQEQVSEVMGVPMKVKVSGTSEVRYYCRKRPEFNEYAVVLLTEGKVVKTKRYDIAPHPRYGMQRECHEMLKAREPLESLGFDAELEAIRAPQMLEALIQAVRSKSIPTIRSENKSVAVEYFKEFFAASLKDEFEPTDDWKRRMAALNSPKLFAVDLPMSNPRYDADRKILWVGFTGLVDSWNEQLEIRLFTAVRNATNVKHEIHAERPRNGNEWASPVAETPTIGYRRQKMGESGDVWSISSLDPQRARELVEQQRLRGWFLVDLSAIEPDRNNVWISASGAGLKHVVNGKWLGAVLYDGATSDGLGAIMWQGSEHFVCSADAPKCTLSGQAGSPPK